MGDDAVVVAAGRDAAGGDEQVPPVAVGVGQYHGVAPRLARPLEIQPGRRRRRRGVGQRLVPAAVDPHGWLRADAMPVVKVAGDGGTHPLVVDVVTGLGERGVEHPPAVVFAHDGSGPDRQVVESGLGRTEALAAEVPLDEVTRDGVADPGCEVTLTRLLERTRRHEEVAVIVDAVVRDPGVPHPVIGESHHGAQFDMAEWPSR
jgi:hypothetical protein